MAELSWLGVVRHGESVANVAADEAEADGAEVVDIAERDADVGLSPSGQAQAVAFGRWLAELPPERVPDWVVSSPYRRAEQTARMALAEAGRRTGRPAAPIVLDERLRDRELGVLDLLTRHGVATRMPEEEARRRRLGKFYYRPPGGESWADVALRLRSFLGDLRRDRPDARVLLFGHEAVVMLLRYLVDGLTEPDLLATARNTTPHNASLTSWVRVDGVLRPEYVNRIDHLEQAGAPVTAQGPARPQPV
ncbi:MAG TPA: histidine phosphatase family protein [Micromonosporaceae bacterium]